MANNNEIEKLKKEYPEFFKNFSSEFLEFASSKETSSKIAQICLKNRIEDEEKIKKIAYQITLVLFNKVSKENLVKILEKEIEIGIETAKKIFIETNQSIFSQMPTNQLIKNLSDKEELTIEEEGEKEKFNGNKENKNNKQFEKSKENLSEKLETITGDTVFEESFLDKESIRLREKYRKRSDSIEKPLNEEKQESSKKLSKNDSYREMVE